MKISEKDKKWLLSIKPEEMTLEFFVSLFGNTMKEGDDIKKSHKSRFETTDEMTLLPSEYFVKELTNTTIGRWLYNHYIICQCGFENILGYINVPITDTMNSKIESKLAQALVDEKITVSDFVKYINLRDNLGFQLNSIITTSFTQKTLATPPSVQKRKKELFKQYDKELNEGNIVISEKIEKELTAMAKQELKGDPGLDLYDSEARGNFGNYKNMNLFKGATLNPQEGRFEIVRSSFMDGIQKEDIASFGTAVVIM